MESSSQQDVTRLLEACAQADSDAANRLFAIVYRELRKLAAAQMRNEKPGATLQPTALVHEVWMKLVGNQAAHWNSRGHFFVAASESMRRILVDAARARKSLKRDGEREKFSYQPDEHFQLPPDDEFLALHEALELLDNEDPAKANLVKLRYFAGMTNAEAASHLGISTATAERYWVFARTWLKSKMTD